MAISHQLLLTLFPGLYAIARFAPHEKLTIDYTQSSFFALTKTDVELSVVCLQSELPDGVRAERDRRVLRVDSVLTFALTGIVSSIAVPLADAAISIFAVSSFDTDYILIADREIEQAIAVLESVGHKVHRSID
ncbi:MAG TPA: ACT domain-containing protein [Candidatus Acidoferrum sp.]|nr:ACT domain-containing protein [Candidatus Acidoferrum sp.]